MVKRKYISEFALNMQLTLGVILQQADFDKLNAPDLPDFHLYMIARRPRIGLDVPSIKFGAKNVTGNFTIQRQSEVEKIPFDVPNHLGTDAVSVICPFPHSEFRFTDAAGKVLGEGKVAHLMAAMSSQFLQYLDLEVLYVGQSYGDEGSRNSVQRLSSHSTLQHIYSEAMQRAPDQEVWIVLPHFEQVVVASFDGRSKDYLTSEEVDSDHIRAITGAPISEQQTINFTEAALIRYFAPEYNVMFKNTFPNPAHVTYSECYDVDLNAVSLELDTEALKCRLWSPKVPAAWLHLPMFPLHSSEERKSMFDF